MASERPAVKVYQRDDGKWDWQLHGENGERVCGSEPQGFNDSSDAIRGYTTAERLILERPTLEVVDHLPGHFPDHTPPIDTGA